MVVKAIVTRAGQIAAATEKQHRRARAVNGRDERGLVIVTTAPLLAPPHHQHEKDRTMPMAVTNLAELNAKLIAPR